jgi:hypothetical protein
MSSFTISLILKGIHGYNNSGMLSIERPSRLTIYETIYGYTSDQEEIVPDIVSPTLS